MNTAPSAALRDQAGVPGGDPAQPPQDLGHVRAEHAPVGMALVHHHVAQPAEQPGPVGVPGQQRVVQHVRGGQQVVRVRPGPRPLGVRGIAVHHGGRARRAAPARSPAEAGRRPAPGWARCTARCRPPAPRSARAPGSPSDLPEAVPVEMITLAPGPGQPRGPGLVRPRPVRAGPGQRLGQLGGHPGRPGRPPPAAGPGCAPRGSAARSARPGAGSARALLPDAVPLPDAASEAGISGTAVAATRARHAVGERRAGLRNVGVDR